MHPRGLSQVEEGLLHPSGLYESTFSSCVISPNVLVKSCPLVSRCFIKEGAVIYGCGRVGSSGETSFSVGVGDVIKDGLAGQSDLFVMDCFALFPNQQLEVNVGSEVGGRPVKCYPGMTMDEAVGQALVMANKGLVRSTEPIILFLHVVSNLLAIAACSDCTTTWTTWLIG